MSLLARSIEFGHSRLAVVRLSVAVHAGASISQDHWLYCQKAVLHCNDEELHLLLQDACRVSAEHELDRFNKPLKSPKEAQ